MFREEKKTTASDELGSNNLSSDYLFVYGLNYPAYGYIMKKVKQNIALKLTIY